MRRRTPSRCALASGLLAAAQSSFGGDPPPARPLPPVVAVTWMRPGTAAPEEPTAPVVVRAAAAVEVPAVPPAVPAVPAPPAPPAADTPESPAATGPAPPAAGRPTKSGPPFAPVVWMGRNDPAVSRRVPIHTRWNFMPFPVPPLKPRG